MEIIKAPVFGIKRIEKEIDSVLDRYAHLAKGDFDRTTKTWSHEAPFVTKKVERSRERAIQVYTDDEVYGILDGGTTIRYTTMTPDFMPKTKPGVLSSFPGQGGVAYIDKQRPRPGIEAREFALTVKEKYKRKFERDIRRANLKITTNLFKRK